MKLLDRLVFSDLLLDLAAAPAWPYDRLMRKRMEFICRSGVDRPGVEDRAALQWKLKASSATR